MRRARIQIKPNIAKAAKQEVVAPPTEPVVSVPVVESPEVPLQNISEDVVMENQNPEDAPSESMKSLHVDVQGGGGQQRNHVHFDADVIDKEQIRNMMDLGGGGNHNVMMSSPTSNNNNNQFAAPFAPGRLMTPRSRNVSMCEDESILQPKAAREKKRFSGKEELDTKTWKMSDLTRWNPRNEMTSFKRERRSSTSSTIITKSEIGDFDSPSPRINAPQVKIGLDGRLVIDETSLVVQSAQINHESVWETVEEGRMGSKITSMSFRNRIFRKPNLWSEKETDLFYEVLQCTGQDFGLMHHYLPQRSRPELKAKYNREERQNWARLLKTISHPVRLDGQLEVRIAKAMAEMDEEKLEKKAKSAYEKEEEKKIREQSRIQKAAERDEDKKKKIQAKELVRQAKELEKDARIAAKLTQRATEKIEKEARAREQSEIRMTQKEAEKEAKLKERSDAKLMAQEAKRIAMEARNIIKEARRAEKEKKNVAKIQAESHNLEREAERIIRRLIQDSQREERRAAKEYNRRNSEKNESENGSAPAPGSSSSATTPAPPNDTIDPMETSGELGDTTSESSQSTSPSESSDEEGVSKYTARREKARMREDRKSLEPRSDKKPVYFDTQDVKYAQAPIPQTISMVLAANGRIFDSADEDDDEIPANPLIKTPSTSGPAPAEEDSLMDDSAPGPSPKPTTSSVMVPDQSMKTPTKTPEKTADEPVPQAVFDVIEEVVKSNRSKNAEEEAYKALKQMEEEKKKEEKKDKSKKKTPEKRKEEKKEEEASEEPPAKMARVDENPEDIEIDVVAEEISRNSRESSTDPNEIIDVVTVESKEKTVVADDEPSTSSSIPSTSSAPSSSIASEAPSTFIPKYSLAQRTVKRPVTWITKK